MYASINPEANSSSMFRIGGLEPAKSNHGHSPHGDTASEQRKAMEASHGEKSEGMAIESSHGDAASVQRKVVESPHDGYAYGQARILVLTSDRARGVGSKQRGSVRRESEGGTAYCVVSEVKGSSGVMVTSTRKWNVAFYHSKKSHIPQRLNQELQIFTSVYFYTTHRYACG